MSEQLRDAFLRFTCSKKLWGSIIVVTLVVAAAKIDIILHNLFPLSY